MRLTESEIRTVARQSGAGEKAVARLLGSLRIPVRGAAAEEAQDEKSKSRKELDLGLRLQSAEVLAPLTVARGREELLNRLAKIVREYFCACPNICAWIGRGDYRADRLPEQITKGMLLHACRTAGRLRAKALRC